MSLPEFYKNPEPSPVLKPFSLVAQLCLTLCHPMDCSTPGFPVHHQLLELDQTHVHRVSDAIQPSHPLSSSSPPAFPSIRVFSNGSVLCIRWPKYWSFSFRISTYNDYSGLISFRIACFDLLAAQDTLKSLLQHHRSKASILQRSAFFIVQLSHPFMTTGKTIALTIQTFVIKVMSLLFDMQPLGKGKVTNMVNFYISAKYQYPYFRDVEIETQKG